MSRFKEMTQLARQALPERDEEMIGDIIKGLEHTNAWCRVVAAQCVGVFAEHLERIKKPLLSLIHDKEPLAREAALGQLLLIVQQPPLYEAVTPEEVAAAASAVIDDPGASERLKVLAETVLRLAPGARARTGQ